MILENFESEIKEAFRYQEGLKIPTIEYEGKIIWNRISSELCFSYDDGGNFILDSMFMINGKNSIETKYMLGVLSSKLCKNWIKNNAATLGDGIYGAKIYIEKFPIVKINKKNQNLAEKIIVLVDEIIKSKQKNINFNTLELDSQINQLVYELYELSDEEIAFMHSL